jgi:aryl-alcohol dehydrogenase-like predicted oxidoreductase
MYDVIETLTEVAAAHGRSPAQTALAWLLGRPAVTSVIFGARTEAQLEDNLGAVGWDLDAQGAARLDAVSAPPLIYPYWHQARTASDRLSAGDATLLRARR